MTELIISIMVTYSYIYNVNVKIHLIKNFLKKNKEEKSEKDSLEEFI